MLQLFPDDDRSFVVLRETDLPGHQWLLRLPEYGYDRAILGGVRWTVASDTEWLRFSWEPPASHRTEIGVAYEGEVTAAGDEVQYQVTRHNVSNAPWSPDEKSLFCLISKDAPLFHDIDGVRTYVLKGGIFQSVNQLVNSRFASHRMCGFPVRTAPGAAPDDAERLMAKMSRDAVWVLGITTDPCSHLSCNQQTAVSCIHANPRWGAVQPGGSATARGKVYLLKGPIDLLEKRYRGDS